jgi:hypothetical protein
MVKLKGAEALCKAPLATATVAVPALATSAAVMEALRVCRSMYDVARTLPFHKTSSRSVKLLPVTVSVKAPLPATTEAGDRPVSGVREEANPAQAVNRIATMVLTRISFHLVLYVFTQYLPGIE